MHDPDFHPDQDKMQCCPSILDGVERTELALGQELHKGVCQTLAGTSLLVGALLRNLEKGKDLDLGDLRKVGSSLEGAIHEVRTLMQPTFIRPEGLMVALNQIAESISSRVPYRVIGQIDPSLITEREARLFYRLIHQAVAWLVSFAEGGEIVLEITEDSSRVRLSVSREIAAIEECAWRPNDIAFAQKCGEAVGMKISTTNPPLASFSIVLQVYRPPN